jgi:hypothetical protein
MVRVGLVGEGCGETRGHVTRATEPNPTTRYRNVHELVRMAQRHGSQTDREIYRLVRVPLHPRALTRHVTDCQG